MSIWEREYGSTTRGHIVTLLRGGNRSVDELAAELGLTDNAVRAHLAILVREQIVQSVGRASRRRRWKARVYLRHRSRCTAAFLASVFSAAGSVARASCERTRRRMRCAVCCSAPDIAWRRVERATGSASSRARGPVGAVE